MWSPAGARGELLPIGQKWPATHAASRTMRTRATLEVEPASHEAILDVLFLSLEFQRGRNRVFSIGIFLAGFSSCDQLAA